MNTKYIRCKWGDTIFSDYNYTKSTHTGDTHNNGAPSGLTVRVGSHFRRTTTIFCGGLRVSGRVLSGSGRVLDATNLGVRHLVAAGAELMLVMVNAYPEERQNV